MKIPRIIPAVMLTAVVVTLTACTTGLSSESASTATAVQVDYFADNALGNPLAIIQHPAGVHQNGVTYVSYQGPDVAPLIASYDHKSKAWQGPFKAGDSDLGELIKTRNKVDSHGKPTMLIDDLGYIHIFYGGHGAGHHYVGKNNEITGEPYDKNYYGRGGIGRNKHAVSKRPYDISEWQNLDNISIYGSYNQAIKMDNGDIYLIYRHGAHRSDWVYQKSTDHGRTFEPAVSILKSKPRTDIKAADSWYIWATKGEGDNIILSYDYHVCWLKGEGPEGLGHITQRHDLYYMELDTKTGTLNNIHDESLPLPLTKEVADEMTLVTKTGNDWTFNGSAHLDKQGYPHLAINAGKNLGTNTGGPKQTYYYRWTGKQWTDGIAVNPTSIRDNTDSRGDFFLDPQTQQPTFWLGYQELNDGVVAKYSRDNDGESFFKKKELLRRPNATWALTAKIHNAHPDAQILVAEKQKGTQWHKMYLLGENGPITRDAQSAALVVNN